MVASQRRNFRKDVLLPAGVVVLVLAVLAGVYSVRAAREAASVPETVVSGTGTLADIPVQALGSLTRDPVTGNVVDFPSGSESSGSSGSAVPGDGEPGEVLPSAGAPSGEVPAADGVTPDGSGSAGSGFETVLWLDGWSAKLAGTTRLVVSDVQTGEAASITFSPLSASQLRAAARTHPEVIESYLARLYTSSSDISCSDGTCTVSGQDVDPGVLADLADVPGLGPVYDGAGITHGLLAARVNLPGEFSALEVAAPSGSTAYLDGMPAFDESTGSAAPLDATPDAGFGKRSWTLAYGLGRVFVSDPRWFGSNPRQYASSGGVSLADSNAQAGAGELTAAPILVTSIADPAALPWSKSLSTSEATFMTSPTTGCGTIVFCTPTRVKATVENLKSYATIACLTGQPVTEGENRAMLVAQTMKVTVDSPTPVVLGGTGPSEGVLLPIDAATVTPVSGPVSFTQQGIFVVTDRGIVLTTSRRNRDPIEFTSPDLFGGVFGPCSATAG